MNIDYILHTLNEHEVAYLLIGGVNFMLRHEPVLTFDVDVWIEDTGENIERCEAALGALEASWGATDQQWTSVREHSPRWLESQAMFCLLTPHGPVDVFRFVAGLDDWQASRQSAVAESTASGVRYVGLCDEDMLRCQLALEEGQRKQSRVAHLERALGKRE
ncbi:MAG: hypothetical protein O3C40_20365 [Planctomycetota bacterium]|nr:hypothetical protein [Planctomycetota bacterium]